MVKVLIRREIWKGNAFVVAREDGRIVGRERYTKDFTTRDGIKQYNNTKSLNPFVERIRRTKIVEIVDFRKGSRGSTGEIVQGIARVKIDGKFIYASSKNNLSSTKEAKRQAIKNLSVRVNEYVNGGYEEEEGRKIIVNKKLKVEVGVQRFKRI